MYISKVWKTVIVFCLLLLVTILLYHEKSKFHDDYKYNSAQTQNHKDVSNQINNYSMKTNYNPSVQNSNEDDIKHKQFFERNKEIQQDAQHQAQELQKKTKNNPQEMLHQIENGFL